MSNTSRRSLLGIECAGCCQTCIKVRKVISKLGDITVRSKITYYTFANSETIIDKQKVEIANQSNTDRMMVSKVLRTLEKKKFISRQEHPTDTRAKVIKLTTDGAKVLQIALTAVENADTAFFSVLSTNLPKFNKNMVNLIAQNKDE